MRETPDLARQAANQHGLLTIHQLRDLGVGQRQQASLVRAGLLRCVGRGVISVTGSDPTWAQQHAAAVLANGAPLTVSHRSALRIHDIHTRWDGFDFVVCYPAVREIPGAIVHRSRDLLPDDCVEIAGLPVTSVARTLCDVGRYFSLHHIERMVDHAIAARLTTRAELRATQERLAEHGRRGVPRVRESLDRLPAGAEDTESSGEIALLRILHQHGLPTPIRQHQVRVRRVSYRLDLAYPDAWLALEYDGRAVHSRTDHFVADRRRQNDLVTAGWVVMRYTLEDLRDRPSAVVGQVRAHLDRNP